jgi:hypothetical protein
VPVNWQITWHTIPLLNELMQKDHAIAVVRRKVGIRLRLRRGQVCRWPSCARGGAEAVAVLAPVVAAVIAGAAVLAPVAAAVLAAVLAAVAAVPGQVPAAATLVAPT